MRLRRTAVGLSLLLAFGRPVFGRAEEKAEAKRTLSVQGQGRLQALPDIATLEVEVRQEGASLDPVSEQVRRGMGRILETLRAQGIADKDLQTVAYEVQPRYERDRSGNARPNGYVVLNRLAAKVRDLKKLGKVLSAAVESGATSVTGPDFDFDNPQELERRALALAMEDARAKAQVLAKSAEAALGPVQSITQMGGVAWPVSRRPPMRAMAMAAPAAPEPIATGEQSFTSSVQVTFEIR